MHGWMIDHQQESAEAARLAGRAIELGKDDALALTNAAFALSRVVLDVDTSNAILERALVLNPNLALAWYCSGFVRSCRGEPEVALERHSHAIRLSPVDPLLCMTQIGMALDHFLAGRYDEASSWAEQILVAKPKFHPALRTAAASHALAGRLNEAKNAIARLRQDNPAQRVSDLKDIIPLRPEDLARYAEGLRRAGLPE
jgi:tetratricopeptide (TPR) repeat protein